MNLSSNNNPSRRRRKIAASDADKRKLDAKGKIPPVGGTVDVAQATWTNTIGDPELITMWKDPDFDPSMRAFYYARVLETRHPVGQR